MRVLFTTQPGVGHFHPLVPLIHAMAGAGHDVAVACSPSFIPVVEASGARAFPAGLDWELTGGPAKTFPEVGQVPPGPERIARMMSHVFAGITAERMADDVLALARQWPFDLVVRETLEYGGCLAAERLDLPHAVEQTVVERASDAENITTPLTRHRERLGLPPDPDLEMPYRYLHLTKRPPSLLVPTHVPTRHSYRAPAFDRSLAQSAPAWLNEPMTPPVIFSTLGTVINQAIKGLFETILHAAKPVAGTLILAVGPNEDPASLGPQPGHIHIDRYVPQSLVFPHCDMVVAHGGSGTMMAALEHGLPLVLIPIAADQPDNAALAAARGVAYVVGPGERTMNAIGVAIRAVLEDSSYRRNAQEVRDEMAALPGVEYAVELLERLAREKTPIPAMT